MNTVKKAVASGYSHYGANKTRPSFIAWNTLSKSPAEDISDNLELLRERSRDLYSGGGPLGRGAIDRLVLNSVGAGLVLHCRIDAKYLGMTEIEAEEWEANTEREFAFWAESKNCDISRSMNFFELQNLAFRSVLLNGDALVMLPMERLKNFPYELRIALIESDRLVTPPINSSGAVIDGGVEIDRNGKPIAYHIANRHPDAELANQPLLKYVRVPAFGANSQRRNVLHLLPMERIGQHRGVPFLAPVIEVLKQISRYGDAELMAAVVAAMFAIFFEHEPNGVDDQYLGEEDMASDIVGDESSNPLDMFQESLRKLRPENLSGMVADLPLGTKATSVSPSRPNKNFDGFVMSLYRQLGAALGIPVEVLILNFESSYSASRGALLEAWKLFKYWREWWINNFCQPIYEEWLNEAVLKGRIKALGYFTNPMIKYAYSWADWTGPSQGQLDPVKEVTAAKLRVENGFSTRQKETAELTGGDFELNHRQRIKEELMMRELTQEKE
ncbi:MAG: phage portal protein [Synergistaceae bacterium]|nr:phage portal protein [Synergistaceae bacterium]MBR0232587.1 phage portal protein [Synergistaceae bacterium]MBR0253339.1 phage portal protein [Synergistaceae bacterium]MBR0316318.1 phage portal protein [Synergistaceae bacterium]